MGTESRYRNDTVTLFLTHMPRLYSEERKNFQETYMDTYMYLYINVREN